MSPRTARSLVVRTVAKAWHDRILGLSAEAAFWQLVSTPSLLLALLAVLGYGGKWFGDDTLQRVQDSILTAMSNSFTPDVVHNTIEPMVHEVLQSGRADIGALSFVIALWAGSSATATFVNTITIAYGQRDQRGAVRSRLLALQIYLVSLGLGAVTLPMLVIGPAQLPALFPHRLRHAAATVVNEVYWPVVMVLLLLALTSLYHFAPPTRLPWRRGLPGAVVAVLVFLCGSALLRHYIHAVLDPSHVYGTLAAPIATLFFFFVSALGVLLGAEFNAVIETASPTARTVRLKGRWQYLNDVTPRTARSWPATRAADPDDLVGAGTQPSEPPPGSDS